MQLAPGHSNAFSVNPHQSSGPARSLSWLQAARRQGSACTGPMAGHYNRQMAQLEALLHSKSNQAALLEREHQLLRQKEAALQNAIQSIEGPLALVTASLGGSLPTSTATGPADSPNSPTASSSSQQMLSECSPASSSSFSAPQLDRNSGSISSRATKLAAAAYKGGAAMLQQITAREEKVQKVLQRLGCCDSTGYKQLYTTWLLQRAVSDPERVAEYVVHPRSQRLKFWSESYRSMALLVGKYDHNSTLSTGNVREQLDFLVDELFERTVLCGLIDPPTVHMSCFMYNVDTQEFEQYPPNWWHQVVEGMQLSPEQKATLKLTWLNSKASSDQLTKHLEKLLQQLHHLNLQQLQSNKEFEAGIKRLPALMRTLNLAAQSRKQERLEQQQQQQQGSMLLQDMPSPQQQQQQQQVAAAGLVPAQQQQQQLPAWQPELEIQQRLLLQQQQQQQQQAQLCQPEVLPQPLQLPQQQQQQGMGTQTSPLVTPVAEAPLGKYQQRQQQQLYGAQPAPLLNSLWSLQQQQQQACNGLQQQVQLQQQLLLQQHLQQHQSIQAQGSQPAALLPLQRLHAMWQQEGEPASAPPPAAAAPPPTAPMVDAAAADRVGSGVSTRCDSLADAFITELAVELELEQQLQQQVQDLVQQQEQGKWGVWPVQVEPPAPAAAAAVHAATPVPAPAAATAAAPQVACLSSPEAVSGNGSAMPPAGNHVAPPAAAAGLGTGTFQCGAGEGAYTTLGEAEEVLLQHGTEERQRLERRIQLVINKLKVVSYCLTVQLTNTLTRKQLALMCVHSHPFVFDPSGICQAVVESLESGAGN